MIYPKPDLTYFTEEIKEEYEEIYKKISEDRKKGIENRIKKSKRVMLRGSYDDILMNDLNLEIYTVLHELISEHELYEEFYKASKNELNHSVDEKILLEDYIKEQRDNLFKICVDRITGIASNFLSVKDRTMLTIALKNELFEEFYLEGE